MTPTDKLNHLKEVLNFDDRGDLIAIINLAGYNAYEQGFRDGMKCFAHWKDGDELVGTCGRQLKEVIPHKMHNYNPEIDLLKPRAGYSSAGKEEV